MTKTLTIPIGTGVWSLSRVNAEGQPLGGVVVDVIDKADPETGEIVTEVVCVSQYTRQLLVTHIDVDDVSPYTDVPSEMRSWSIIRKLCREVALDGQKARRGIATPTEQRWLRWAWRLATEGMR